jgi:hypothetical protein
MSREVLTPTQLNMPTVTSVAAGSLVSLSLTPAAVATIVAAKQSLTVAGLNVGDSVIALTNPISNAVALTGAEVSAANTLRLTFVNPTAGPLTPTAGTYTFLVIKGS